MIKQPYLEMKMPRFFFHNKLKNVLYLIYGKRYRRDILENGRKKGEVGREEQFVPTCLKVDQHS